MPLEIQIGDIIDTKKPHPCGNNRFEVLRIGMDFRIKCIKCEKQIWISRANLEKRIRKIERQGTLLKPEDIKK
ncbi:DUF951 domain-containing protein [Acidaminobacter hydrogenoformans]|uniref:DUF951 domain-containing protein n=1 Tax=Acidaminobacter hydrogenoformans DSM 2784 TaxID=1120920 RepID=A0A1G5RRF6_9FIRM|nr:DUF951 domain-containing protein [Acidaminobacter hydrogenoformans]SCZ76624.1 hypothetical protein SAMN03080599_00336 [Acidaminobacter hydrogenoformans DSM 2784]